MEEEKLTVEDVAWLASMHMDIQFRLYDVMISILAATAGADTAKNLQQLHEDGQYLYPPPVFGMKEEAPE